MSGRRYRSIVRAPAGRLALHAFDQDGMGLGRDAHLERGWSRRVIGVAAAAEHHDAISER